jgi:hypothetical protein
MKPWFSDARPLDSLEADICFLLQDSFYFGPDTFPDIAERKSVELLPRLEVPLSEPTMVRSSELIGSECQLVRYYQEIVRLANKYKKSFNQIRFYFWLRLWIWNTPHNVYIHFPWYDSFSEMDRFFSAVRDGKRGEVFFDTDQGWDIEVCAEEDDFFIGQLSNALGDDVWTNYVTNAKFDGDTSSITRESRP